MLNADSFCVKLPIPWSGGRIKFKCDIGYFVKMQIQFFRALGNVVIVYLKVVTLISISYLDTSKLLALRSPVDFASLVALLRHRPFLI